MIKAVLFDFGGVLAEEAFKQGLMIVAKRDGLDPDRFFETARDLIYKIGYVSGTSDEPTFWKGLRNLTGIKETDEELREEILSRFTVRPGMISYADRLRSSSLVVAILSDQTDWLDEINRRTPFYHYFDYVFNSFYLKKTKRDVSIFRDVCSRLGFPPGEVLLIDDSADNIKRASGEGLKTILFRDLDQFEKEIENVFSHLS